MNLRKYWKKLFVKKNHSLKAYAKKFNKYALTNEKCKYEQQYEASITRLYHTIEKGLSFFDFRPGFGQTNVESLVSSMEQYAKKFDTSKFFYRTALSVLNQYVQKNTACGYDVIELKKRIELLPGTANNNGGVIQFDVPDAANLHFEEFVRSRHSIRHFSNQPLALDKVKEAISLAQYTPSACNRQGWKCYIVEDKEKIEKLLRFQNGNSGFGQEFDKLILIVADLRAFSRSRETFQAYIDGGMYAMRVLDSLFCKNIAACPLSASLTSEQEKKAREIIGMDEAEVFILYIGIGNYPDVCQTARSERHEPNLTII